MKSGWIMTEAMRIARGMVKAEMRRQGKKISDHNVAEITKAAKTLLDNCPEIMAEAEANVKKASAKSVKG